MSYSYIFFYRYENGTEGFGYFGSYKEANERMTEFALDSEKYNSKVQFGIAEIADYGNVGLE